MSYKYCIISAPFRKPSTKPPSNNEFRRKRTWIYTCLLLHHIVLWSILIKYVLCFIFWWNKKSFYWHSLCILSKTCYIYTGSEMFLTAGETWRTVVLHGALCSVRPTITSSNKNSWSEISEAVTVERTTLSPSSGRVAQTTDPIPNCSLDEG